MNTEMIDKINTIINYNIDLCSKYKNNTHYSKNIDLLQKLLKHVLEV